jgi:nitroimidazol reductase NimA-like FMN-containing flavoprotein (pyridoxamine 5'-phosphate oxidase superfamily)
MDEEQARLKVRELLETQPLGVLATSGEDLPHATLVAFASTTDLRHIVFASSRSTRKVELILKNPHVALLVDNRTNEVRDFRDAWATSARGRAAVVRGDRRAELDELYLAKYPHLSDFVRTPTCELVCIEVEAYDLVGHFQDVSVLQIDHGSDPSG